MQRKIILFELNEVPFKVVDQFCKWRPESVLAQKIPGCRQFQTHTQEISPLSPWTTWPSVHRGVNDEQHMIQNFGQDLSEVNKAFPTVWEMLRRHGVTVGICGTLHTYPMPEDLQNYAFYIPDTFAAGSECFPQKLSLFQEFNLRMARDSARNVARGVPWMQALKVLARAPELGFKLQTLTGVAGQLLSERAQKWRTVRRRTYQSVLAFDIYMKQLQSTKPAFSSFFTNHVASSMHRFWAAIFPEDYEQMGYDKEWIKTYRYEIDWTMRKADEFFARLVRFADRNPEYQVWVATSMGQAATVAEPLETQLYITDLSKFMAALGFEPSQWSARPAMLPQANLLVSPGLEGRMHEALSKLVIDDVPVPFRQKEHGFFSIDMGQKNMYKKPLVATLDGHPVPYADLGMQNIEIEDKSDANAYHIPEGCLLIYDPLNQGVQAARPEISTLDIAPAILRNFAVPVPKYMAAPTALAAS
jgi:hypothetical protein